MLLENDLICLESMKMAVHENSSQHYSEEQTEVLERGRNTGRAFIEFHAKRIKENKLLNMQRAGSRNQWQAELPSKERTLTWKRVTLEDRF